MPHFKLNSRIILDASGPHAIRYLNARLTNDIAKLEIGSACMAAALTPQGKTEGVFSVVRIALDRAILICDGGNKKEVISAFKRYMVADRLEVKDISSDWILYHIFDEESELLTNLGINPAPTKEFEVQIVNDELIIFNRYRSSSLGLDILVPASSFDKIKALFLNTQALSFEQSETLRIKSGIPSFPKEINSDRLFLEAMLPQAISSVKGCYTGQEVVERIISQGKSPKVIKLCKIIGNNLPSDKSKIHSVDGVVVGEVLSSTNCDDTGSVFCLISIKNAPQYTDPGSPIVINGVSANII